MAGSSTAWRNETAPSRRSRGPDISHFRVRSAELHSAFPKKSRRKPATSRRSTLLNLPSNFFVAHPCSGITGISSFFLSAYRLTGGFLFRRFPGMSMVEIIQELPKLTPEERVIVLRRLRELDGPDEALFLHEAAESMFQETDQQEAADARRKTR